MEIEEILQHLEQVELAHTRGGVFQEICKTLGLAEETVANWQERYAMPLEAIDNLTDSPLSASVLPFFLARGKETLLEQIGSGVLIRVGDELFILTAAHVFDHAATGDLYIPGANNMIGINGYVWSNPVPSGVSRTDDKLDIAYCRLRDEMRNQLHPSLRPAAIDDLMIDAEIEDGDIFTFVGFPLTKGNRRATTLETELTTFTGHACSLGTYSKVARSRRVHIAIRMRLKKTFSARFNARKVAPRPHGISGGAILAWPRRLAERLTGPKLKLVGIANTFLASENCMIGTRLPPYLMTIIENNPKLLGYFA